MRYLLASMGSDGDVHPFFGLGSSLVWRGHEVIMAANESYASLAKESGFQFHPLLSNRETDELLDDPDVWHPLKCGLVGARWGGRLIEKQYELLRRLSEPAGTVLVTYPAVMAARLVQEKIGRPLVSVVVMPWMIPDLFHPPVVRGWDWPAWTPRVILKSFWEFSHRIGDLLLGRQVNRMRHTLGLRPIRHVFKWWLSPERVIGMFPEWYAPLPSSYSLPIRLAGFPLYDRGRPLPPELLTFCQAGAPPIAITFGTGHRHAKQLFALATEAVGRVGGRALLLTRYKDQLPSPLPSYAQHCEYASFSQLLPHCGAIIHHGGVGTTAQALAAGIPQLIMPLAFDQPDNAARIKKLGSGDWVKPSSTVSRIAEKLSRILSGPMKERARTFRECLKGVDSCAVAVNWIEAESKLAEQAPRATH